MKIIKVKDIPEEKVNTPLFTAPVTRQSAVRDTDGADKSVDYIHFPDGVRNKLHKHSTDQVLVVTEGTGLVGNKTEQFEVHEGDVIWTPAGEPHWHGAASEGNFTHISITNAHTELTQLED